MLAATGGLVALMVLAVAADAGVKSAPRTTVVKSGSSGWAYGALGTARNSPNSSEYIECGVYAYSTPATGPANGWCFAYDSGSNGAYCSTATESQIKAILASNGDSFIYFSFDGSGTCTYLSITNGSMYEPKQP